MLYSLPSALVKELIWLWPQSCAAEIPPGSSCLVPQGDRAFGWRNLLLTQLPDTSNPNKTQICHHHSLLPSRAPLQNIGGDFTVVIPDLGLGLFSHWMKKNNAETCHLDGNLNVSLSTCILWVGKCTEAERKGGKSLKNATLPLTVMKLSKKI